MQCTAPLTLRNGTFPCGKCLSCRIAKAREWSARLMHELAYWNSAVFVTLTYSDKYLPENRSLRKADLQKFFKRLRKGLHGAPIKYFACGEYGEHTARPHYHAIIFGLGQDTRSREHITDAWRFCEWSNFAVKKAFGTVTYDSCRYVSDYIFKKYNGELAKEVYLSKGLEVPFKLSSQGLGLRYCLSDAENLKANMSFSCHGAKMALPRYYAEKLGVKLEPQDDLAKWQNYANRHGYQLGDIGGLKHAMAEQRALTTEARINLRKKGSI